MHRTYILVQVEFRWRGLDFFNLTLPFWRKERRISMEREIDGVVSDQYIADNFLASVMKEEK